MSIHGMHGTGRSGRLRALLGLACAAGLVTTGCTGGGTAGEPVRPISAAGPLSVVAYSSCDAVAEDFRAAYRRNVSRTDQELRDTREAREGAGAPAAAPEAAAEAPVSSPDGAPATMNGTNVQEAGVDEPDLVKTDGRRVVTVVDGNLRVLDVTTHQVTGSLRLPGTGRVPGAGGGVEMFLAGDRALVLVPGVPVAVPGTDEDGEAPAIARGDGSALVLVDLAGAPRILGELAVDGAYVDARMSGTTARVVVRSTPRALTRPEISRNIDSREGVEAALDRSTADDWLPRYALVAEDGARSEGRLTPCERVSRTTTAADGPGVHNGDATVSLLTFDLTRPLGTGDPITVAGSADTVYGTANSLYIAAAVPAWATGEAGRGSTRGGPGTVIHRFDISGTAAPRRTAGTVVEGALLDQYAMSEYDGRLRVATTVTSWPTAAPRGGGRGKNVRLDVAPAVPATESFVVVLEQQGDRLAEIGRVGGMGRGERIHSVRFLGTLAYVVTFRQTDPLYTVDLTNPRAPRVLGELKINGYSAYLHPLGGGRLLGVGQDATGTGRRIGTQISLFDVADPADPRRVAQYTLPGTTSEIETNPRAFVYRPDDGLLVIPVRGQGATTAVPALPEPARVPALPEPVLPRPTTAPGGAQVAPSRAAAPDLPTSAAAPRVTPVVPEASSALVLRLRDGAFTEVGRVGHPGADLIRRSVLLDDRLWTVSATGVRVSAVGDLAQVAWIPFQT